MRDPLGDRDDAEQATRGERITGAAGCGHCDVCYASLDVGAVRIVPSRGGFGSFHLCDNCAGRVSDVSTGDA